MNKSFVFIAAIWISLAAKDLGAQPATTHIHDLVLDGGGHNVIGSCTYWSASRFTAPGGYQIVGENVQVNIVNGVIDFLIVPTDSATPANQFYNVRCRGQGGWTQTGVWIVPTTGSTLPLSGIWAANPSPPGITIPLSQLGQVGSNGTAICSNGTSWVAGSGCTSGGGSNADWTATSGPTQILNKPTLGTSAALNVGTGAGQVAAGNHTHSGVYEPVDTTLLRQSNLAGTGTAVTPARSDHNHTGTYQPVLGFTAENVANKGANSGYASLNSSGKITPVQLCSGPDGTKFVRDDGVCAAVSGGAAPSGPPNLVYATDPLGSTTNPATLRVLVDLDIPSTVVRNSAVSVTPTNNLVPRSGSDGKLSDGWLSANIPQLNLPSNIFSAVNGNSSATSTLSALGLQFGATDPIQSTFPNIGALRAGVAFDVAMGAPNPSNYGNVAGMWGRALAPIGRNSRDNNDKKSMYGISWRARLTGSGQRAGLLMSTICTGQGDCFAVSPHAHYINNSLAPGDEGVVAIDAQVTQNTGNQLYLSDTIITTAASSCAVTALSAGVTKSGDANDFKTVTVTGSTANCNIGDRLHIDNGIYGDVRSIVNTSGVSVSWVSGNQFPPTLVGQISINNTLYTVSSVSSPTAIVLTGSAGTQTGVQLVTYPIGGCGTSTAGPNTDFCHESVILTGKTTSSISALFQSDHAAGAPVAPNQLLGMNFADNDWGQDGLVVFDTTRYSTGTAYAVASGLTEITGIGTTWTSLTGYNQANLRYCISFRADDFTLPPYSVGNPLISYFPLSIISGNGVAYTGNYGYTGAAVGAGNASAYSIVDCAFIAENVPTITNTAGVVRETIATIALRSTGFTWTSGHIAKQYPAPNSLVPAVVSVEWEHWGPIGGGPAMVRVTNRGYRSALTGLSIEGGNYGPDFIHSAYDYGIRMLGQTAFGAISTNGPDLSGKWLGKATYSSGGFHDSGTIDWAGASDGFIQADVLHNRLKMGNSTNQIMWSDNVNHDFGLVWNFAAPVASFATRTITVPDRAGTPILSLVYVQASDPGCTDIGMFWFDTTTTTTASKKCVNVSGTLTWVSF